MWPPLSMSGRLRVAQPGQDLGEVILLGLGGRQHVDVVVVEPVAVVPAEAGMTRGGAHLVAEAAHVGRVTQHLVRNGSPRPVDR